MRHDEAARAAALAATKGGFLTPASLRQDGFAEDLARREVAAGRWQRPVRGFYVPDAEPIDDLTLARIAIAYGGTRSRLTGCIAARALRMRWVPATAGCDLLVPADTRRRSTAVVRVRRARALATFPNWRWEGVPTAPPPRVVLDVALSGHDLRDTRGILLGSVADGFTTPDELDALLTREPRNGTASARRAIADARRGAASPPEAEVADRLIGCGLPFLLNPDLYVNGTLLGRPDGYFPGLGAGWEVDSRERHAEDDDFDATLARHGVFGAQGIVLEHLTPRRFRRAPALAVDAVLAVARSRLVLPPSLREPVGLTVVPRGPLLS